MSQFSDFVYEIFFSPSPEGTKEPENSAANQRNGCECVGDSGQGHSIPRVIRPADFAGSAGSQLPRGSSSSYQSPPPPVSMVTCDVQTIRSAQSVMVTQNLLLTALILTMFLFTKSYFNRIRRQMARCTVFVIGAGPTGMVSALLATRNQHVEKVIVYEDNSKAALLATSYQLQFTKKSRNFLRTLGIDFDNLEGCMDNQIFHTRVGVFLEHVMELLHRGRVPVTFKTGVKFTRDRVPEIEGIPGRKVVVAADGSSGQSARLLGLSDEFVQSSCHAYGAVASLERTDQQSVPLAERRVHGLQFDLTAYGIDYGQGQREDFTGGFSLKLFGNSRNRHLSLALPKTNATLVKNMRLVLDRSMMRNIFIQCFKVCKWSSEQDLVESWAVQHLQFSPRLFDIKLFQRIETVAYFQDADMFVLAEGEAARCSNFRTGLDVNMAIAGLPSLVSVLNLAARALSDFDITDAMLIKSKHSNAISRQFLRTGLKQDMFSSAT